MKKLAPLALLALSGCAVLVVGAVLGAVAIGSYLYVNNELSRNYDARLDLCWEAAKKAVREMNLPIEGAPRMDAQTGEVLSRMSDSRQVRIYLERLTEKSTKIVVRVGDFESDANKGAAQRFHEEIYHQLTGKYESGAGPAAAAPAAPDGFANQLREDYPADYERVFAAALAAVQKLQFKDVRSSKDALKGKIDCARADGTPVEIVVDRTDKGASVAIRVGTNRGDDNAKGANALKAHLRKELGLK
jgi:hypothetical protein